MQARHQYLKAMGIDVWLLRDTVHDSAAEPVVETVSTGQRVPVPEQAPVQPTAGSDAGSALTSSAVAAPEARREAARPAPGPVPQFHLCFCDYGRLSLCFSLPKDAAGLDAGLRRFGDDIAYALGVSVTPNINSLSWPMVDSKHLDQSEAAASTVIRQRLRPGEVTLLFGAAAQRFVSPHCKGQWVALEEFESYMATSGHKRGLWRAISGLRAVLSK